MYGSAKVGVIAQLAQLTEFSYIRLRSAPLTRVDKRLIIDRCCASLDVIRLRLIAPVSVLWIGVNFHLAMSSCKSSLHSVWNDQSDCYPIELQCNTLHACMNTHKHRNRY